jgi:alginate O-acetyltransferase complex protein AlgI
MGHAAAIPFVALDKEGPAPPQVLFPTVNFAIFFVVVFSGSWLLRRYRVPWLLFLLAASWFFYGYWDERFVLLLAASTLGNWAVGRAIANAGPAGARTGRMRSLLALGVVLNLSLLGWFKYYGFFADSVVRRLDAAGIDASSLLLEITLPVGISFFTFQAMSYLIDLYRGKAERMSLLEVAVYLSFFPQLVAGPIVRATEFVPQLRNRGPAPVIPVTEAFTLILLGLFKKVVISSYLATEIVDPVFAVPGAHSSWEVLIGVYAYAIVIYADFSGYTDIAIGCALLLGFRFPRNFNAPYRATSIRDFWQRWHMTLSNWLRDYLYIPLGGSRGPGLFTYRNLMLTMVLGGLWHGAAWTFVIWGTIHGAALAGERLIREYVPAPAFAARVPSGVTTALRWLLTFNIVSLAWIFFRAESFGAAIDILERIVTAGGPSPLVTPLLVAVIVGSVAVQLIPRISFPTFEPRLRRLAPLAQAGALGIGLFFVDALGPGGVAPFIYFQF